MKNQRVVSPALIIDDIEIPPVALVGSSVPSSKNGRHHKNWFTRFFECRMPKKAYNPDPTWDSVRTVVAVILFGFACWLVWFVTSH